MKNAHINRFMGYEIRVFVYAQQKQLVALSSSLKLQQTCWRPPEENIIDMCTESIFINNWKQRENARKIKEKSEDNGFTELLTSK